MKLVRTILAVLALTPVSALAAGGHDAVGCSGCHSLHAAKGELIFAVAPNTKYLNPKTKQPYGGTTALCLACHQDADKGGQGFAPVAQHTSHPFQVDKVNACVAQVPASMLRDGRFECMSCHDPHPSNTRYKYLRVETANGKNMDAFCAACHPMKADPSATRQASFEEAPPAKATAASEKKAKK